MIPPIKCAASGCFRRLAPRKVFCADHWNALPRDYRDRIYSAGHKPEKYAGALTQAVQWLAQNTTPIDNRRLTPVGNHYNPEDEAADQRERDATDTFVTKVAAIAHEVNRAYCTAIGDTSQMAWADAPPWQQKSAVVGVRFTILHPNAGPAASHESWLAEKAADGWQYGLVKDPVAKRHPCFTPYDLLPLEQRAKDYLFQAVVRSVVAQFR